MSTGERPASDSQPYMEIWAERQRQDEKWGSQRTLPPRTWITILGEEFGEVCRADQEKDPANYRAELIQVAAVAVAAIESFDAGENHAGTC